jgi:hypothetical protein
MNKKVVLRVFLVLVLAIILALMLLPGIVKRYSINHSKELVGRQIQMDKLRVNYFTGMIRITDFVMFEANEKDHFLSFDTLIINLVSFQFFIDDFVMEQFYLKGLRIKVIQEDSVFNFDDLIAFHSAVEDKTGPDPAQSDPFQFHLSNIELKKAELIFDDRNINKVTDLKDISFFVPYIGWNQEDKSEAGLRFAFKNEGYFESSINVDPVEGDYEAEIIINRLYLEAFKEYVASTINISHIDGIFNSRVNIAGNINEVEKSLVSGNIEILDFEMDDLDNRKFMGAKKLECLVKKVDIFNMSFVFDSLLLSEPYVYFELDTATNNFFQIFNITPDSTSSDQDYVEAAPADSLSYLDSLYYALNFISIDHGAVDYRDNLTGEPFDYYLSDIVLESDSITSTSDWVDLYAEMLLNKRGTLKAEVGLDPSNPYDIKLNYVISDFMLSDLNIYSRFYMGFPIVYGDMYYKSETEVLQGQLTSENKLIITHVELGEKSGGLYDLPLKFALFLLKDRDGVITLDIPVRGDLNDPTVKIGKIVWNTFKNLIIKVAAAPFDLLAGLLSVDPKDIQEIKYEYSDTTLTEERQRQLDLLLELEKKKEGLEIELVYFKDVEKEKESIAIARAGKEYFDNTAKDYRQDEEGFNNFLWEKLETDTLDIPSASMQISDPALLDSLHLLFDEVRKDQIEQYLSIQNDSTLIYTSVANPNAPKNVGSLPVFEVKYSMQSDPTEPPEKR